MPLERAGLADDRAEPAFLFTQPTFNRAGLLPADAFGPRGAARRGTDLLTGCQNESISVPHLRSALALRSQQAPVPGSCCFNFSDLSEVNRETVATSPINRVRAYLIGSLRRLESASGISIPDQLSGRESQRAASYP